MPTDAGKAPERSFRDRPLGRIALLLAVLILAFGVSRSCGSVGDEVSQDEAIEIAREQVDFEPDHEQVRLFKKGAKSIPYWGVSLYKGSRTRPTRCRVVQVDARTGEVVQINSCF